MKLIFLIFTLPSQFKVSASFEHKKAAIGCILLRHRLQL